MTDLDKLIAAVEAGNSEWDADFIDGLVDWDMNPRPALLVLHAWCGSLDAAHRLHEALLPGLAWSVFGMGQAVVSLDPSTPIYGGSSTPARAWLLAILRALKAQGGDA